MINTHYAAPYPAAQMRLRLNPAQPPHSRASMPGPESGWLCWGGRFSYFPVTFQGPLLRGWAEYRGQKSSSATRKKWPGTVLNGVMSKKSTHLFRRVCTPPGRCHRRCPWRSTRWRPLRGWQCGPWCGCLPPLSGVGSRPWSPWWLLETHLQSNHTDKNVTNTSDPGANPRTKVVGTEGISKW